MWLRRKGDGLTADIGKPESSDLKLGSKRRLRKGDVLIVRKVVEKPGVERSYPALFKWLAMIFGFYLGIVALIIIVLILMEW